MVGKNIIVNGISYKVIKIIGKGQAGYSYLLEMNNDYFVLKQFHNEINLKKTVLEKYNDEINIYNMLLDIGILMPKLIYSNSKEHYLIKEYIDGYTLAEIVGKGLLNERHIIQIFKMCKKIYKHGLNLDYFPTNFVEKDDILYYIDYGCDKYTDDWNFENNGIYFLANTVGIAKFIEDGNYEALVNNGKPHKSGFESTVKNWLELKKIM